MMSDSTQQRDDANPKSRPFPWRCPECGKKEVRLAVVAHTSQIKHDGRLYAVEVPKLRAPRCEACGELMFDNAADEQIAQALRKHLGLLSCSEIRKNREQLSLSQRQLAEYLGVAVETISRWETGSLTQSRAMDRYLRVYFGVPEVRAALLAEFLVTSASNAGIHS
jgi:putative zinc finger/helix-turn-helix YgiT family protein